MPNLCTLYTFDKIQFIFQFKLTYFASFFGQFKFSHNFVQQQK